MLVCWPGSLLSLQKIGRWSWDAIATAFTRVWSMANFCAVIAGFFTGGALAIRGGLRSARNSAIGCACLLAVIEGVGIGMQRAFADNTRLDVCSCICLPLLLQTANWTSDLVASSATIRRCYGCLIINESNSTQHVLLNHIGTGRLALG